MNWNENWKWDKNMKKVKISMKKDLKLLNWNENWKQKKNMNKVKISMKKRAEKKI